MKKYEWVVYYVDPSHKDYDPQQTNNAWGHGYETGTPPGVLLNIYARDGEPEDEIDVLIWFGEHRGDFEMKETNGKLTSEEVFDMNARAEDDPKIGEALELGAEELKNQNVPYKVLGTGTVEL